MRLNPEVADGAGQPVAVADPGAGDREIILIGLPNVGKSVIFSLLTGRYVNVSNYPGTTVEIATGSTRIHGEQYRVRDTPGVHTLLPLSQDERVTRDILLQSDGALVVQVADAKSLSWSLQLTLQLLEMGKPLVLCLNMSDEADERGIRVDTAALEARLGIPVVSMVAVRRQGLRALISAVPRAARGATGPLRYNRGVEEACAEMERLIPGSAVARRSLALMILSGDDTLREWLQGRIPADDQKRLGDLTRGLRQAGAEPVAFHLDRTRLARAEQLAREVQTQQPRPAGGWAARLEPWTIHPVGGIPILAAALYSVYLFVGVFGAGTAVDWLETQIFARFISPWATSFVTAWAPWDILRDFLVGEYGQITMALSYAVAIVLPIVATFFIAFGLLEDSGYLPRLAVMLNRIFKTMGLNGKAVLPMVLGLGCDTMATLTTRVLETRKERAIVMILLAVGVPCSAQLAVIFALLGALSPAALVLWLLVVIGVIILVGALAARVLPGRGSDFVLELPPLRLPRLGNIAAKTVGRLEWYLREAVPLFLVGTAILFALDRLGWLTAIQGAFAPVVVGLLGLPVETAEAFLLGFLRRDFGAAGLFQLQNAGSLDPIQTLVSVVTMTLFIPCIAHFFMIIKERNLRFAVLLMAFTTALAVAAGAVLNLVLRALEVSL
jgi:ferrous iron transport protein B